MSVSKTNKSTKVNLAYYNLHTIFEQYYFLKRNLSILNWDSAVYMPLNSIEMRSKQVSAQNSAINDLVNHKKVKSYIDTISSDLESLDISCQKNFKEIKKIYNLHKSVPIELQNKISEQASKTEILWRNARDKNDFSLVQSDLDKTILLTIEKSKILSDIFDLDPYSSLMQEYDYGVIDKEVAALFNELQNNLPKILSNFSVSDRNNTVLDKDFQKLLCTSVLKDFGFNFMQGRLDESSHPFTEGGKEDNRITTHYSTVRPFDALHSVIHEFGHALYDANLPQELFTQPIGYDMGMMFHEATALFYEMCIFRTDFFVRYIYDKINELDSRKNIQLSQISNYLIDNSPSLIRIQSGEIEYLLHIIMRYNIEKLLLSRDITTADLPHVWNELMVKLLNNRPASDKEGCLQDIHWYLGLFGYFPSYGLGCVLASNIYTNNNIENILTTKHTSYKDVMLHINTLLIDKLFSKGRTLSRKDLIKVLIGDEKLNAKSFVGYLKRKYTKSDN